ncbi:MAG: hypothetical protein ACKVX7_00895 [Planctomycetota bacterium]
MATALVLAANLHAALQYYRDFPQEPIKASGQFVQVRRALPTANDQLATLLRDIARSEKHGGDVVIVCHGTDLALQVKAGPAGLGVDVMRLMIYAMDGRITDADLARRLGFARPTEWLDLRKLIEAVWKLNLKRVDLRACEVGKNNATMYFLQRLFNCNVCCAPKGFDVFGTIQMGTRTVNERAWTEWQRQHPSALILGTGVDRFALQYQIGVAVQIDAMAASDQAARNWVARYLPPGNYRNGPIHYHALTPDKRTLIFAGEARYRDILVESHAGAAEPKLDLNSPLIAH